MKPISPAFLAVLLTFPLASCSAVTDSGQARTVVEASLDTVYRQVQADAAGAPGKPDEEILTAIVRDRDGSGIARFSVEGNVLTVSAKVDAVSCRATVTLSSGKAEKSPITCD